jgi:hypothetical protein
LKFSNITFTSKDSNIILNDKEPKIEVNIKGLSVIFEFDYSLKSTPELIEDTGHAIVVVDNLDGRVLGTP